jgi:hypothetical protein
MLVLDREGLVPVGHQPKIDERRRWKEVSIIQMLDKMRFCELIHTSLCR